MDEVKSKLQPSPIVDWKPDGILKSQPSPPWGRGWRAPGAFTSRGATREGVLPLPLGDCWFSNEARSRVRGVQLSQATAERDAGYFRADWPIPARTRNPNQMPPRWGWKLVFFAGVFAHGCSVGQMMSPAVRAEQRGLRPHAKDLFGPKAAAQLRVLWHRHSCLCHLPTGGSARRIMLICGRSRRLS